MKDKHEVVIFLQTRCLRLAFTVLFTKEISTAKERLSADFNLIYKVQVLQGKICAVVLFLFRGHMIIWSWLPPWCITYHSG